MTNEMRPTSIASSAHPSPEPVSTRRCRRVKGNRSRRSESVTAARVSASVIASCYGCGAPVGTHASRSRTIGATFAPYSSMERIMRACDSVPVENFMSKRCTPSVRTVSAIFRATVSGEPT